jgi:hypothetical protein
MGRAKLRNLKLLPAVAEPLQVLHPGNLIAAGKIGVAVVA